MTTLPRTRPPARSWIASGTCSKAMTLSSAGVSEPASISPRSVSRSSVFGCAMNVHEALTHEKRHDHGAELAVDASRPTTAVFAADDDQRAVGGEHATECRHRTVAPDVENKVVAPVAVGDVGLRVVDHMIGAERAHHVDLLGARHAGNVRSEGLRDLHGKRPDAPRRSDDQHALSGLEAPAVAEGLQSGDGGDGTRGLLEGQVRRHTRELVRCPRRTRRTKRGTPRTPRRQAEARQRFRRRPRRSRRLRAESSGLGVRRP